MRKVNDEDFPQHLGLVRDTFLYEGKISSKSNIRDIYDYQDKHWCSFDKIYMYMNRFWEKHIGDDYSKCRKMLIHNIGEKFGLHDYRVEKYVYLETVRSKKFLWYYWNFHFYVDEDGKICKTEYHKEKINDTPYEKGTKEYYRYKAELKDRIKKKVRDYYKNREAELEELLPRLVDEMKAREMEENLLKMQKHGFDETSFRGEEYHGQKRKRK